MSKLCKRILLILAVFSSFLTLFACSAIQIDTYHVELPQDKYQLRVGQEIEALPIVSKNGQECDLEVSYHSYDASIATYVDGKIVALKSGEVRIKVTLKNNSKVYATALVTVVNDDSLIVDFNYEKTMIKGTTQLITYELLVEKNRKLTFTSSNENVATIDELGNIKAITVGTTTIETVVSSLYDEGVSKTYKLVIEVKDLTFAINYVLDGGTNSENNPNEYVPEKLPLLLEDPTKSGYKFVGWYDNENFTGEAMTEISASYTTDITLYAKFTKDSSAKVTKWKLVTDASSLKVGDEIVIASNSKGAIAGSLSGKFLTVVEATFNSDKSEITSPIASESIFVLGGEVDKWSLTNSNGKMLGASAAKSLAEAKGTTTWKITIASNNATISSTNNSYGRILHNVSSTRFLNYTSSTKIDMLLPQIYKKVVE